MQSIIDCCPSLSKKANKEENDSVSPVMGNSNDKEENNNFLPSQNNQNEEETNDKQHEQPPSTTNESKYESTSLVLLFFYLLQQIMIFAKYSSNHVFSTFNIYDLSKKKTIETKTIEKSMRNYKNYFEDQ